MQRSKPFQLVLVALLLLSCCSLPASAASIGERTLYFSGQHFTWSEFSGGRRLLKESGPLFAGGFLFDAVLRPTVPDSLVFRAKNEVFGGFVDYDGETQAPNPLPVRTEVSYVGTRHDLDLGFRHTAGSWFLEPFGGIGYRWWLRGLQDTTSASGVQISGYTEYWKSLYLRLGARANFQSASGISIFAEGGGKRPFYTGNSVRFVNSGDTTFRPEDRWSGFAETGLAYQHLKLSLTYEGFRFGPSPVVRISNGLGQTATFFQPESSSDIFGVNLGWMF